MTLEGCSVVIKFFKVHHFLHLERRRITKTCFLIPSSRQISGLKVSCRHTNQAFVHLLLKGELPPPDEGDPGEDVSLQDLSEQNLSRLSRSTEDEAAFVLLPEIFLQGLHVLCHAVCQIYLTLIHLQVILPINTVLLADITPGPLSLFTNFIYTH